MHEPLWFLTRFPGFLRNTPSAPARANSNLGGSFGAGRRGERSHEWRGGRLMSHECRSTVSKSHQQVKVENMIPQTYLSGEFTCLFSLPITISHLLTDNFTIHAITVGYIKPGNGC